MKLLLAPAAAAGVLGSFLLPLSRPPAAAAPQDPVVQDPAAQDPAAQDPAAQDPAAQDPAVQDPAQGMREAMERVKKFTQPGKHHELLRRFVGEWNTESRLMMSGQATPAEKGTATFSWLMDGRWLQSEATGSMMGMAFRGFSLLGYDNFKQSYVLTTVQSMDTAMNHAEGDLDPGGEALLLYGTLDEYTTGEHDKMVKYVWRFRSADEMVLEVHDLPIGERHTQVIEVVYRRK
ncbi:MAG: DUF1579 family protein [Planctomycetota bacterium]